MDECGQLGPVFGEECGSKCQEDELKEGEDADVPAPLKRQRFYFESDMLALKNNPDYQKLLRTLATLEAQKMQAIKDLETLAWAQTKAERDPQGFVEALKDETLKPLPVRQQVAQLPDIEWKGYIDSLQLVTKQQSSVYLHTRRQRSNKSLCTTKGVGTKSKDPNKPPSFRQPWSPEEQAKFEELLLIYPPELVDKRRYEKIAIAMGTRTPQQVASHVQKYFIKLAKAGLPVPGKIPNLTNYTSKSKKTYKGKRGLARPSTFFSSLAPMVYMTAADGSGASTPTYDDYLLEDSSDDDDDDSVTSELVPCEPVLFPGSNQGPSTTTHSIQCMNCCGNVTVGVYWQCTECPEGSETRLCTDCVNSDYQSASHSPSHDMQVLSLAQNSFTDRDYTRFTPQSLRTKYNYLDPNFYPAS